MLSLVTGANGFTGRSLALWLARKNVLTRGMFWPPDGEPDFGHEKLEIVPGDLRDRESLKKALDGVGVVYTLLLSTARPMCSSRCSGTSMSSACAT